MGKADLDPLTRYGQTFLSETQELLKAKLTELNDALEKETGKDIKFYNEARDKCPDEVNDTFKLKHLRCEVFRVNVSTPS